jgi:hypothetical protein
MKLLRVVLGALGLTLAVAGHATKNDLRSISGMRQYYRVLIVFTPSLADARLTAQRAIMAQISVEAARRDVIFVQVDPMTVIGAHDHDDRLRRRFHVPVRDYRAFLIDKDGRILREAAGPIEGAAILHAIDAASPHQIELQRTRAGKRVVDKS